MATGARRGELCALRWKDVDHDAGVLAIRRSICQRGRETGEKDTKNHQKRRVTLDSETLDVLAEHRKRAEERVAALGVELSDAAFVFSLAPDGSTHLLPDSVSQRYGDLARRLGIRTSLHKLRHYSATELIAAGVNARTVADRLGRDGGGTTTLRYYTAWVSASDQRAASALTAEAGWGVGRAPRTIHGRSTGSGVSSQVRARMLVHCKSVIWPKPHQQRPSAH
jgi:integrase